MYLYFFKIMEIKKEYFQFKHPFTCMIAGPTSSGKTVFVRRLLDHNNIFFKNISNPKVIWMYGQWQSSYSQKINCDIQYNEGLMSESEIKEIKPDIIIIDDLMSELGDNVALSNLFTKGSHHMNVSIIFIVQNVFHQGKQMRNISLNSHYFILMKNPRDKSQIMSLARQLYPKNMKYIIESYEDATKEPYSYIKIDLTPSTPDKYRLQSRLFPEELPPNCTYNFAPIIYLPK